MKTDALYKNIINILKIETLFKKIIVFLMNMQISFLYANLIDTIF